MSEQRQADWAERINQGDYVYHAGENRRVNAITARGIAAPLFRLEGVDGLVSHALCAPARFAFDDVLREASDQLGQ